MCTLTVIPCSFDSRPVAAGSDAAAVRVACNRDESRLRPPALAPQLRRFANRRALLPVDPVSDGTWIAVNDAQLVFVLMNVYTQPITSVEALIESRRRAGASRGTIIPRMLAAESLDAAFALAADLDCKMFEPFRLFMADRRSFAQFVWADGRLEISRPATIEGPLFFTSSGLGDELVANPRRRLFERVFAADADWLAAQDAYHRDVQPGKEFASVWMTRPEARTVSLTVVEMLSREVQMRYYARDDDGASALEAEALTLSTSPTSASATSPAGPRQDG